MRKAEGDLAAATDLASFSSGHADQVCYFAQHAAEKFIKAVLVERSTPFPFTHDLTTLIDLLAPPIAELSVMRGDLDA